MLEPKILIPLIIVLSIFLLLIIIILFKRNKKDKYVLTDETLENIYLAFGEKENIKNINRTQDRVRFTVNNVSEVNNNLLTKMNISAFLKGKEITILFKEGSKELESYIKDKLKE